MAASGRVYLEWLESRFALAFFLKLSSLLDVVNGAFGKPLLLFFRNLALHLSWNSHHQASGRNLCSLSYQSSGRNHGTGSDPRAVQHHRADSDQAIVFDRAAMQRHRMA